MLFYVIEEDDDGKNFDLFVMADDAAEAVSFWRTHWEFDTERAPTRVAVVPTPAAKGAVEWKTVQYVEWE